MNSLDVMKKRVSVRTYDGVLLREEDKNKILNYINDSSNLKGPFGTDIMLELIELKNDSSKEVKLGTYGIIKGHSALIAGIIENNKKSILDFGYVFEKLILVLTNLNIGTCWMGGTYDKKALNMMIDQKGNQIIPAITPLGYIKEKKRITDKIMRRLAKADNRRDFSELFYSQDFNHEYNSEMFKEELEMVRIAPSASNKQPWRVLVKDNIVHFYIERTEGYGRTLNYDIQLVDIGIAMAHFELACNNNNKFSEWINNEPSISTALEYVISMKKDL